MLFICTHNAELSQMAKWPLRVWYCDRYEAASAGIEPKGIHPLAGAGMVELEGDVLGQRPKTLREVFGSGSLTMCGHRVRPRVGATPSSRGARSACTAASPASRRWKGMRKEPRRIPQGMQETADWIDRAF